MLSFVLCIWLVTDRSSAHFSQVWLDASFDSCSSAEWLCAKQAEIFFAPNKSAKVHCETKCKLVLTSFWQQVQASSQQESAIIKLCTRTREEATTETKPADLQSSNIFIRKIFDISWSTDALWQCRDADTMKSVSYQPTNQQTHQGRCWRCLHI